jgi:hypothetical protein
MAFQTAILNGIPNQERIVHTRVIRSLPFSTTPEIELDKRNWNIIHIHELRAVSKSLPPFELAHT